MTASGMLADVEVSRAWTSMLCIRSLIQPWLSFTLMNPGPAKVGFSAIMEFAGSASTMAFATSVGFFGAPSFDTASLVIQRRRMYCSHSSQRVWCGKQLPEYWPGSMDLCRN